VQPFLEHFAACAEVIGAEFVLAVHSPTVPAFIDRVPADTVVHIRREAPVLEGVLDDALPATTGRYVLRMDDDEMISTPMIEWLRKGLYLRQDSWFLTRFALWPDRSHVITAPCAFFPDFQVRLTTRAKFSRPPWIHAPAAHPAWRAPHYIEHHAFLVKTKEERRAMTAYYHSLIVKRPVPIEEVTVVCPEDMTMTIEPFSDDLMERANEINFWRKEGNKVPETIIQQLRAWGRDQAIRPEF
jgi:hypothetical protein